MKRDHQWLNRYDICNGYNLLDGKFSLQQAANKSINNPKKRSRVLVFAIAYT